MIILACRKHPLYKAKQPPRCDCYACKLMYALVMNRLANIDASGLRITQ